MSGRFDYVQYDNQAKETQAAFKEAFERLEFMVNGSLPKGRAQAIILTKLEEAYAWVGKAIRDDQVARDLAAGRVPVLQEGRGPDTS